jgi:type VI secretion system secreted protein Hcp
LQSRVPSGSVAGMAEKWFLKVDGIDGASTASGHQGEIDILSWSWGVVRSGGGASGTGAGTAKARFEDFHFVARIDKASPALFVACATGQHIKGAELQGTRGGKGKANTFLTYKLSDVSVTEMEQGDADTGAPIAQFSFDYKKIEMTFTPQLSSGKLGTAVHAGFDTAAHKQL